MLKPSLLTLIILLLISCASSAPTSYYELATVTINPISSPSSAHQVIGIGPTTLPGLLNRKAIVTHNAEHNIQLATTHQWAEPLAENIPRVIARNLSLHQPGNLFHSYPWTAFGPVNRRIVLEILQFDAQLGQLVIFEAIWSIKDESTQQILAHKRTRLERPLKSDHYTEMVGTMSEILGMFSQELSDALLKL